MRDKVIRQAMDTSLRALTRVATSDWVEERGLREPAQRLVQAGARNGIMAAGKLMDAVKKRGPAPKPRAAQQPFDLNPTEDQQMILDMLKRVSNDLLLPMAQEADEACAPPEDVLAVGADLGLGNSAIPEALGGGGGLDRDLPLCALAGGAGDPRGCDSRPGQARRVAAPLGRAGDAGNGHAVLLRQDWHAHGRPCAVAGHPRYGGGPCAPRRWRWRTSDGRQPGRMVVAPPFTCIGAGRAGARRNCGHGGLHVDRSRRLHRTGPAGPGFGRPHLEVGLRGLGPSRGPR